VEYSIEYAGYLTVTGAHLIKQGSERAVADALSFAGQFRSSVTVVARDLESALAEVRERALDSEEFEIIGFEGLTSFEHIWISRVHQRIGNDWVEVWESDREEESWIRIG
jgi:hypothetical protein